MLSSQAPSLGCETHPLEGAKGNNLHICLNGAPIDLDGVGIALIGRNVF